MDDADNGWDEHKRLIMSELADLKYELRLLSESQIKIREDLAGLKALAGLIGGLAGSAASLIGRLF